MENGPFDPREQGAWPKIMMVAGNKKMVIWEQGAQKMVTGSSRKLENNARSKRNYQGAR